MLESLLRGKLHMSLINTRVSVVYAYVSVNHYYSLFKGAHTSSAVAWFFTAPLLQLSTYEPISLYEVILSGQP